MKYAVSTGMWFYYQRSVGLTNKLELFFTSRTQQDLGVHIKCWFNFESSRKVTFCFINTVFFRCCEIMWIPSFILQSEKKFVHCERKEDISKLCNMFQIITEYWIQNMNTKCNSQCLACATVYVTDCQTLLLMWVLSAHHILHAQCMPTAHCSLKTLCWIYKQTSLKNVASSFSQD